MQRQRGELVPVGEVIADLPGPVQAIRKTPPPAQRHFTRSDQVNQLVSASEADADLGFMARMMALCSLPRTNPGDRIRYKRVNGPYTLYMTAGGGCKTSLREFSPAFAGLGLDRSGTHPKPRVGPGSFAFGVHAVPGRLYHQWRNTHPAAESDEAAF